METEIRQLEDDDAGKLLYDWDFWSRPAQRPPSWDWFVWLILTGRGWGKSRTGAQWVRACVESGKVERLALVARTAADVRDVVTEGESGILAISPPWFRPTWEPSRRRLTWPNGAIATTFSADEPDALRGPQHDAAWADEAASWRYPETWDNLMFGLRIGAQPRVVVTTTPRPTKLIKELVADPLTHVTRGSTYDNLQNLAPTFARVVLSKYEGTTLGRQEIAGEILSDIPGALWRQSLIDQLRVASEQVPPMLRIVVAIDPAMTSGDDADETGIVVAGLGADGHGYVFDDLSLRGHPQEWASVAVKAYRTRQADRIIGEVNNGGEMVEHVIRTVDPNASYKAVRASRGKHTRAEPIAALYEQKRIHHIGVLPKLEDQMCTFLPPQRRTRRGDVQGDQLDDRMDALVWALTELFLEGEDVEERVEMGEEVRISPY